MAEGQKKSRPAWAVFLISILTRQHKRPRRKGATTKANNHPHYIIISANCRNSAVMFSGVFANFSSHSGKCIDKYNSKFSRFSGFPAMVRRASQNCFAVCSCFLSICYSSSAAASNSSKRAVNSSSLSIESI